MRICVAVHAILLVAFTLPGFAQQPTGSRPHNVIIFVADGLRRDSVNEKDTPALWRVRKSGIDFPNSHSVYPTFTTANASVIATGHGLGDTGDYSNTLYPGVWLTKPDVVTAPGSITPFLEANDVLADMNGAFGGNYLGERPLLSFAREKGVNVASVGKLGPTAIQLNDLLEWDASGALSSGDAIIIDDSTGQDNGVRLSPSMQEAMEKAGLPTQSPLRSNGFGDTSQWNNGFTGDAVNPGTLAANYVQEHWFTDVTTKVLLPSFAAESKPFLLLFWSRDPDGTQHNNGDSLQQLSPGINGDSVRRALQNADNCLGGLLDWLDANPAIKATTDVVVTSDHGFATLSRREIAADGTQTSEPSAVLDYELSGKEKAEPKGTLPNGFLAVDLAIRAHMRMYDPAVRAAGGPSVYAELAVGGEKSQHPSTGSALLGDTVRAIDGSDARVIVAGNGGSDLLYVPSGDVGMVHSLIDILTQLDYVGGIFVDDQYCREATKCGGALRLSDVGLVGSSKVVRPAIVVNFKEFYRSPNNLLSGIQVADTALQEGQGNHGGFGRDQTLNNMAAIGPDFRSGTDPLPMGNIDIAPTVARILGLPLPTHGKVTGRVLEEALKGGHEVSAQVAQVLRSQPAANGMLTLVEYQEYGGVRYLDRGCLVGSAAKACGH
ncbi:MAG TPA: alkaline phosphatase family protein [Acidobacteriaceae bacterium]|jgi:predicted AlkP superfamily pyrophosphatase or phosphodiesterase|nr:alkaline phosphatase family protein [Acidobacteriaceae bacterium]